MADTPADARPPPLVGEDEAEPEPAGAHPPRGDAPVERVGGVRVVPGVAAHPLAGALATPPHNPPGGPLVGGAAAAFAGAPRAGAAALKGHDDEVKALHGGPPHASHAKAGQKKGVDPGISPANKVMDPRRTHYGVPQGRRTGG
jgi:hypothetical protein